MQAKKRMVQGLRCESKQRVCELKSVNQYQPQSGVNYLRTYTHGEKVRNIFICGESFLCFFFFFFFFVPVVRRF